MSTHPVPIPPLSTRLLCPSPPTSARLRSPQQDAPRHDDYSCPPNPLRSFARRLAYPTRCFPRDNPPLPAPVHPFPRRLPWTTRRFPPPADGPFLHSASRTAPNRLANATLPGPRRHPVSPRDPPAPRSPHDKPSQVGAARRRFDPTHASSPLPKPTFLPTPRLPSSCHPPSTTRPLPLPPPAMRPDRPEPCRQPRPPPRKPIRP